MLKKKRCSMLRCLVNVISKSGSLKKNNTEEDREAYYKALDNLAFLRNKKKSCKR